MLADCGPVINVTKDKLDETSLKRLRTMYSASRDLAMNSIKDAYLLQNKGNQTDDETPVVILEPINIANSTLNKEDDDIDEDSVVISSHLVHDTPHGRQSSFFQGFRPPFPNSIGGGGPFGGGSYGGSPFGANNGFSGMIRPPPLPPLPSFPAFGGQQQPRPPKTSIIGNGGGPMALTNDNVVVVNVLSSNF